MSGFREDDSKSISTGVSEFQDLGSRSFASSSGITGGMIHPSLTANVVAAGVSSTIPTFGSSGSISPATAVSPAVSAASGTPQLMYVLGMNGVPTPVIAASPSHMYMNHAVGAAAAASGQSYFNPYMPSFPGHGYQMIMPFPVAASSPSTSPYIVLSQQQQQPMMFSMAESSAPSIYARAPSRAMTGQPVMSPLAFPQVFPAESAPACSSSTSSSKVSKSPKIRSRAEESVPVPEQPPPKKSKWKRDPNAPKNPLSAYLFYVSEQRSKKRLSKKIEGKSFKDVALDLGEQWRSLSPIEKAKYEEMARQDKLRYHREKLAFMENRPEASSSQLNEEDNVSVSAASVSAQASPSHAPTTTLDPPTMYSSPEQESRTTFHSSPSSAVSSTVSLKDASTMAMSDKVTAILKECRVPKSVNPLLSLRAEELRRKSSDSSAVTESKSESDSSRNELLQ